MGSMEEVASRTLDFLEPGGAHPRQIRIVLGKPEQEGDHWIAPYGIYGPEEEAREYRTTGEDSMQAVFHALHILPVLVERLFNGRGALSCYEGAWDIGLGRVVLPPTPGVVLPSTP